MNFGPIAPYPVFFSSREKQSGRATRIHDVPNVGDPHRHALPVLLCDGSEPLGAIERARFALANFQSHHGALGNDIEHCPQAIRAVSNLEPSRKPEAAIGAADPGPLRVNRAARPGDVLVDTRYAAELSELIHPEHRAAQGALSAGPLRLPAFLLFELHGGSIRKGRDAMASETWPRFLCFDQRNLFTVGIPEAVPPRRRRQATHRIRSEKSKAVWRFTT
jgi:hypothetical protein